MLETAHCEQAKL